MVFIISYANNKPPGYFNFINSIIKYNQKLNYKIIGMGEKWNGFMTKINACYTQVLSHQDSDIICILDCFDVMACNDSKNIEERFLSYNSPIVVGAESSVIFLSGNSTKLPNYWKNNNHKTNRNLNITCLNAGCIIGYTYALKELMKFSLDTGLGDDQITYHLFAEKYPTKIKLDLDSKLFGNIPFIDLPNFKCSKNGKIIDTRSLRHPCFIHIPGTCGDFNYRMNHFGKFLLGDKYNSEPYTTTLSTMCKKIVSKSNRKAVVFSIFIITIFICLILFIRKLKKKKSI
jgi:hypothetical protein